MAVPLASPSPDDIPELIEQLGAALAAQYHDVEATLIRAVAAELRAGNIGSAEAAARLGKISRDAAASLTASDLAAQVIAVASSVGVARVLGESITTPEIEIRNSALVLELRANLDTMTTRISQWAPTAYRTASSMLTQRDAQDDLAQRFLARGITGKTYANGARMPIGSYAEMVTRTATNEAAIYGSVLGLRSVGMNLCSIIIGVDACSSCAANSGKVFSLDGTPAGVYTLPDAINGAPRTVTVAGPLAIASNGSHFRGPNCRCQVVGFFVGQPIPRGTTHDPIREAQRDQQRYLERQVRYWKAREAAALNDAQETEAKRRILLWQKRLRGFTAETGRNRRNYREQLTFSNPFVIPPSRPRALTP